MHIFSTPPDVGISLLLYFVFLYLGLPWYNRHGWLGSKNNYLPSCTLYCLAAGVLSSVPIAWNRTVINSHIWSYHQQTVNNNNKNVQNVFFACFTPVLNSLGWEVLYMLSGFSNFTTTYVTSVSRWFAGKGSEPWPCKPWVCSCLTTWPHLLKHLFFHAVQVAWRADVRGPCPGHSAPPGVPHSQCIGGTGGSPQPQQRRAAFCRPGTHAG